MMPRKVETAGIEPACHRRPGWQSIYANVSALPPRSGNGDVVRAGIEPAASTLRGWRDNQLLQRTVTLHIQDPRGAQ